MIKRWLRRLLGPCPECEQRRKELIRMAGDGMIKANSFNVAKSSWTDVLNATIDDFVAQQDAEITEAKRKAAKLAVRHIAGGGGMSLCGRTMSVVQPLHGVECLECMNKFQSHKPSV